MVPAEEGQFQATSAWRLFWRVWGQPGRDPSVIVLHGGGEHSGRHAGTAARLVEAGLAVYAFDLPGHGRSPGKRGHIAAFEEFVECLAAFVDDVTARSSGQPPALLGHSLGGLVALLYASRPEPRIRCLALSSPLTSLQVEVPLWKRAVARALVGVWPSLTMRRPRIGAGALSHDPLVEAAYAADPLVHFQASLKLYMDGLAWMARLPALLPKITIPMLVMLAGDDRIASTPSMERLFPVIGTRKKRLIVYSGFSHEILHEVGKEAVFADLIPWLQSYR